MKKILIVAGVISLFIPACQDHLYDTLASVTTAEVSDITQSTVTSGGHVEGYWLRSFGLCCSTKANPTVDDIILTDSVWRSNSFKMKITGLLGNTKYYLRAFATNKNGVGYGNEVSFTTKPATVPVLFTETATNITSGTVTSGGQLLNSGGANVTDLGICWSNSINPTSADFKISYTVDSGHFISPLTGLSPATTYYVRTYATNKLGTGYGNEITFTTRTAETTVTDIDGNVYSTVKIGEQTWLEQNLKTTRYLNGDLIGTTIPENKDIFHESDPKYQWAYNGDERNVPLYGRLYTWFVASDARGVCPIGWHVATHNEWLSLIEYLAMNGYGFGGSGKKLAKSIASTSGWFASDSLGSPGNDQSKNNSSGFSGLPGGGRGEESFGYAGYGAYWWSSSDTLGFPFDGCNIFYTFSKLFYGNRSGHAGFSIRCIKD
jgi:uncharacterized protein (TIGR02145 family)